MELTCALCGRRATPAAALAWTTDTDAGRTDRYCETCSREHLRAIEAKLDPEHW